jgi:hypothetical protein
LAGVAAFLLLLNSFALTASAAGTDDGIVAEFVGKNWVNGRSWDLLDYSGRLGFVCGLFDGVTLFYSAAEAQKKASRSSLTTIYDSLAVPTSVTVGDVVRGMDEFYQDAANIPLPAICAYLHFVYKSRGDSGESISNRLAAWRKMFPDNPPEELRLK